MRFFRKKQIDWESPEYKRARFHYLLQILYGESLAIDYCTKMSAFAPTTEARDFLMQQQKEEDGHLELLTDMVAEMERPPEHISPAMKKLHALMEPALEARDWPACILVQNFVVEGLSVTLCEQQAEYGDDAIQQVFKTIIADEVRHVAFGVEELRKVLLADTDGSVRKRLIRTQRWALLYAILLFKDLAPDADELGIAWDDLAEQVVEDHMQRIERAGFHIPLFDRLFLKTARTFFVLV